MEPSASRLQSAHRAGAIARMVQNIDPRAIDVLIALTLTAVGVAVAAGRPLEDPAFRREDILGVALVCAQTLPLAFRRTWPLGVVVFISVALIAHSALGYEVVQTGTVASLVAVYGVASLTDARRALMAVPITAAAIAGFYATNRGDWGPADIAATSATWAMAWCFGTFVRLRGEQADAAGARVVSLELEQDARALEAVADERARMTRELHDIVGHALNVIVIQASGAQRVFDAKPDVPREALASIESAGREALDDMERMLGVLRAADSAGEPSSPQPGLAQLDGLAAHVSEAGLPVEVIVVGEPIEIPASLELSAYRIVQESLTNCLKHSDATLATVTIRYRAEGLEVEVADDGRGSPGDINGRPGGRGQLGMRERVALFGGEIHIGPNASGRGYGVRARLPYRGNSG